MARSYQRSGCMSTIAVLLVVFGILQLVLYFNPNIVVNATATPASQTQAVQPTCNGQPMSPGDVCDVYENGVLVRTETYEDRLAAVQEPGANPLTQVAVTLTQPNSYIFGLLALGIGLLILLVMRVRKGRITYQERIRR